jgi:DNA-binding PadR family transcriptional regulator
MSSQPHFYAVIPATVRYDKNLVPNAKLLYGELTAMCNVEGYCWAENSYFSNLYNVTVGQVSRWISQLESNGYISSILNKKEGNSRKIYIKDASIKATIKKGVTSCGKAQDPLAEKRNTSCEKTQDPRAEKRTSIYENITINNTINKEVNALAFFELNSPSEWENFQMRFKKNFDEKEWLKFKELFDCKVTEEGLEYTTKILGARLKRFAINYCDNLNKSVQREKTKNTSAEVNTTPSNCF